jgi:NAD(P)-dependent dehydrogenase (short-subunit alcohol dehydrogenase family)
MNIVVVGGATPGKFGNEFALRCRAKGHRVKILTWRDTGSTDPDQVWADFTNVADVVQAFNRVTHDLDRIDIVLWNINGNAYPWTTDAWTTECSNIDSVSYVRGLTTGVIVPHALSIAALPRMDNHSSLVFMTTGLAVDFRRTTITQYAGYAGVKGWVLQMMLALAFNNDRGVISTAIAPRFDYDDPETCSQVIDRVVEHVLNLDASWNGKIVGIDNPTQNWQAN